MVGLIAIYKFFLQRPALTVSARTGTYVKLDDGALQSSIDFYISNDGLDYAEDAYVELELEMDMDTADRQPRVSIQGTTTTSTLEFAHAYRPESITDAISGEVHKFSADGIIYRDKRFKLHSGGIVFEESGTYSIEYSTTCRSHQPRAGEIRLSVDTDEDRVTMEHNHPFRFRRSLARLVGRVRQTSYNAISYLS